MEAIVIKAVIALVIAIAGVAGTNAALSKFVGSLLQHPVALAG